MLEDRKQRAAVRLIKEAATRAGLTRSVKLKDSRTCANCANSADANPARCLCGLCAGPASTLTRWEPIKIVTA